MIHKDVPTNIKLVASYKVENEDEEEVDAGCGCRGNHARLLVEPLVILEVHRSEDGHPIDDDADDYH